MDKETRNAIQSVTQRARKLLEEDFAAQLDGDFDVHRDGSVASKAGSHLSARQAFQRERIIAAIEHKRAAGMNAADAARDYLRDAAFTALNRFVALKMLEARELVQECITKGEQSAGYREFCGMAPGLPLLPDSAGYRLYIESLFDELSTEVKVLFDRRDPSSVLRPKRATFEQLLKVLNAGELARVWGEDETIGWVYQFFNGEEDRKAARYDENGKPKPPKNSRDLAVRNQFFTPRYVVQFLTDNALGRIWYEMRDTNTVLAERCGYMVRQPIQEFKARPKKDPRDLRVLDPACGSGHFLLYAFGLLVAIYEEAHADPESPSSEATGRTLAEDYPSLAALRKAVPGLVLAYNLHGVDIDARCAQIAQLALWMRAQRTLNDYHITRAERPPIRRSNIVLAEPIPAGPDLRAEFCNRLADVELVRRFDLLINEMRLAGELGILLRLETLVGCEIAKGDTRNLFARGEEDLRLALQRFAQETTVRRRTVRRLFSEDALAGLGLVETVEQKFDVVLMNPPFGAATVRGQDYISKKYAGAHSDIFAALVRRARALCPDGLIGVISSRSFLVKTRLETFRRHDILPSVILLLDLGLGIMDGAAVESAAYVLGAKGSAQFLAADQRSNRSTLGSPPSDWIVMQRIDIERLTLAKILCGLPKDVYSTLQKPLLFEPVAGTAREGMKSFDNDRFLRAFWETSQQDTPDRWRRYAKGGRNLRIIAQHPLMLRFRDSGRELDAVNINVNDSTAQVRQANTYWGRPGATYSRRAPGFAARWLPAGYVFSDMGPAVLPTGEYSSAYILGWLNSRLVRYLVHLQTNKQDHQTGIVKRLPWVPPSKEALQRVERAVISSLQAWLVLEATRETSPYFVGPGAASSLREQLDLWARLEDEVDRRLTNCLAVCDDALDATYDVDSTLWPPLEPEDDADAAPPDESESASASAAGVTRLVVWAVGVALGYWIERPVEREVSPVDPFDPPPVIPPGRLTGACARIAMPDDKGHPDDLLAAVFRILASHWSIDPETARTQLEKATESGDVRDLLREPKAAYGVWPDHLRTRTAQKRIVPILWRIGIPSGEFSVWLNSVRANNDTLYTILHSFVEPKLSHARALLAEMTGISSERAHAKAIRQQMGLVDELGAFRDELARLAPLWVPQYEDGALICACPLWRLFGFDVKWQDQLRTYWGLLCEGAHDWAHLAMHLWPERVVPRCAKDRSLAIAHGLEDVFWVEGADGKWTARKTPTKSVEELVTERASPAVKLALKTLLEAPAASGKSTGRKGGGRRKAAAAAEGGDT